MQELDIRIPLSHGYVHEVTGGGDVHVPGDGEEDFALHLQDFVAGLGVVRGFGEVLDAVNVDLFLLRSDLETGDRE